MDNDGARILSTLATLRRRAFIVLAVRYVLLLIVAAALLGLGFKGVAVASLMAVALAVVRCPDLRAVAKNMRDAWHWTFLQALRHTATRCRKSVIADNCTANNSSRLILSQTPPPSQSAENERRYPSRPDTSFTPQLWSCWTSAMKPRMT